MHIAGLRTSMEDIRRHHLQITMLFENMTDMQTYVLFMLIMYVICIIRSSKKTAEKLVTILIRILEDADILAQSLSDRSV